MPNLSENTKKLISQYQNLQKSQTPKENVSTVHVDEVASAIASFYEKIRGVVEWREEHLLRRAAIERKLKRRLFLQKSADEVAEPFVLEMIRGGHFPNDSIEEKKIEEIKKILNKYIFILENSSEKKGEEQTEMRLYNWLLDICACEIEETLSNPIQERALVEYMTAIMKERIQVSENVMAKKIIQKDEIENQVYIAVQRALFKMDNSYISYHLLKKKYRNWPELSQEEGKSIAQNIYQLWKGFDRELKHPLSEKFYQICEKYDTPYLILGDVISQNPLETAKKLSNGETLESQARSAYQKRLSKLKSRVSRAAFYSTVSIFMTKMLLAFAIEVPFDKYVLKSFNYETLWLNIIIPPLLMFLLILTIRPPGSDNLEKVIVEVIKIVYENKQKEVYPIKAGRKKSIVFSLFILLFYLITFIISFGAIIWIMLKLKFSVLSMIIFLMFLSLISFAGVKLRERSKELQIVEVKSRFLTFLIDSFSMPFLRIGRWLSKSLAKYNVLVVILTALVDMPFQLFTEFIEHWRAFLKEKKEEIH